MLSFHLKLFSHRDLQALQQSSHGLQQDVQTNKWEDGNTGVTQVLVTRTYINVLTPGQSSVLPVWGHQNVLWHVEQPFFLFTFSISWQNYLETWMTSPGRETAGGWTDNRPLRPTLKTGESRWGSGIPKWVSDWSLLHARPFLPPHQTKTNLQRMAGMYWARRSSWENSFFP